jgi:hypothetical protein
MVSCLFHLIRVFDTKESHRVWLGMTQARTMREPACLN